MAWNVFSESPDGNPSVSAVKLRKLVYAKVVELEKSGHMAIRIGSDAKDAVTYDRWKVLSDPVYFG